MDKMNKPHRFRGDLQFQRQVRQRTREALLRQEADFARLHGQDTDQQLLDYVRRCSGELGRMPHAGEIVGGTYIAGRLRGWEQVIAALGLPPPPALPALEERLIYRAEYRRQEQLLRRERSAGRVSAKEERSRRDAEGRDREAQRQERDLAWGREHEADTDAQLLAQLRDCAAALGHSPTAQEMLGAAYIARRFGSWAVALTVAGLPLPKGVKPPNPKTLKAYRERARTTQSGMDQL